jgi:hypothetical protein
VAEEIEIEVGAPADPEEQEELARQVGEDLTDAFIRYVHGELPFVDLTFLTHDALQDVYFIGQGDYEIGGDEDDWDDWDDEGYDLDEATAELEELAQEPARDA